MTKNKPFIALKLLRDITTSRGPEPDTSIQVFEKMAQAESMKQCKSTYGRG